MEPGCIVRLKVCDRRYQFIRQYIVSGSHSGSIKSEDWAELRTADGRTAHWLMSQIEEVAPDSVSDALAG